MSRNLEAELYKTAVRTFEELSLMLPDPELEEVQQNASPVAAVAVDFYGAVSGKLIVRICGDVLPAMAAGMLGEERSSDSDQQLDALREITNVICGNLLPSVVGAHEVVRIDAPQSVAPQSPETDRGARQPTAATQIGLDQGRADIMLYLDT